MGARLTLIVAAVVAGLYGLHRLAIRAEERGWIYYRKRRGSSGALGRAALEVHALIEPSMRHVVEERRRDAVGDEEAGEPPSGGPEERSGRADAD